MHHWWWHWRLWEKWAPNVLKKLLLHSVSSSVVLEFFNLHLHVNYLWYIGYKLFINHNIVHLSGCYYASGWYVVNAWQELSFLSHQSAKAHFHCLLLQQWLAVSWLCRRKGKLKEFCHLYTLICHIVATHTKTWLGFTSLLLLLTCILTERK